jgi:membrane associated rhomboid family serine protease
MAALGLPALLLPQVDLNAPDAAWPEVAHALVLHPDLGLGQPAWVWWTTAWLHGSAPHLWRNLGAWLLIAALGHVWRAGRTDAWLLAALAWPLTQLGMVAQTSLHHYVGLSGVLHAAAALLLTQRLLAPDRHEPRWALGLALAALIAKTLMENPWQFTLVADPRSAINVAPWVHFCGAITGSMLGGLRSVLRNKRAARASAC